ncbi:hypothetical protein G6F42_028563 [Rhizopus arrhizus]|nr:hypothetical protein G6F42_028563 [Rhizopus arrhizus]
MQEMLALDLYHKCHTDMDSPKMNKELGLLCPVSFVLQHRDFRGGGDDAHAHESDGDGDDALHPAQTWNREHEV